MKQLGNHLKLLNKNNTEKWLNVNGLSEIIILFLFFLQGIFLLFSTPTEAKIISAFYVLPTVLELVSPGRYSRMANVILACGILMFTGLSIMILLFFGHSGFVLISAIDISLFIASVLLRKRIKCNTGSSEES